MPTKITLQVRGIHGIFVSGIHFDFGVCVKFCLWNPGSNRHKIERLSSAQFSLVMFFFTENYKGTTVDNWRIRGFVFIIVF